MFSFTSPSVTFLTPNMAINGGVNFDLPLASATNAASSALSFLTQALSGAGTAFVNRTTLTNRESQTFMTAAGAVTERASKDALTHTTYAFNNALANMNAISLQQTSLQRYVAKKSKSGLLGRLGF